MKHYIIDGNNLIGKIPSLKKLQSKNKQLAREKLAHQIDRFFNAKDVEVFLHFDGFENQKIKSDKIKLIYSEGASADEKIKAQIRDERNPKNLTVVTSDHEVINFVKVCRCKNLLSEDFKNYLTKTAILDEEEIRIRNLGDSEDFRKIFGV